MGIDAETLRHSLLSAGLGISMSDGGYHLRTADLSHPVLWSWEAVMRHVLPSVKNDGDVLDIGCGAGVWLLHLWNAGYRNLHGIEPDPVLAEVSRSLHTMYGVKASIDENSSLAYEGGGISLLTAYGCLFDIRRADVFREEENQSTSLTPSEFLARSVELLGVGGFVAFDWYVRQETPYPGRSYFTMQEVLSSAPSELKEFLVMQRIYGGREICLYVYRKQAK